MARRKNENIEEIKIKASQEGLNEATQSAEKLEKQTGKAKKSAKELSDTLENTGKGAKDAAKGIQVLDGQMKEFAENVKAVREALEGIKAVLDTKGIKFDTTGIQQQIGDLKTQINGLSSAMTQAFKDDVNVPNWIRALKSAVGDIGNIRNKLFNNQESLPIKVNPVLVDKQGNEIREFVPLKEMSEFFKNTTQFQKSIPLKSIDELVVKLNEISRIMREIMTGLRLDSKLPSTVLEQEEKRITEIIESLSKEVTKYDKLKSKFTGLDENGKFHSNSTISTARQIFEREMPEEKDIQRFEKEIVKLLSFGEDLQNISIKVKGGVANYFQIVQQMIGQYRGSMLKLGEGGLLDFLPSYFEKLRDSQGKISWGKQIIDENSFAQQYKKLLAEQKYYQKQFSYAKAREEQVSATSLDDKTINAVANAFQNVKINAVEAGTTINSVAQLDTEQLNSLIAVLENVVTWLTNINTALNTLSTNASILQSISNLNFDVNEQTKIDDLAASVEDKNKQYLDFLERINSLTNSILESISKIQVHANELNLDKLFKNFNTQKVGTKEEIEKAKADVIAVEKSVKVGKAWVDQADALNKLADAYSKFKQVGGTESITDFTKKSGLAKQIDQRMTTGERVSLPIDIVPQITQDFLGQIRQAIGNESIYVDVKPDILNVISNFIQPITDAVKGTPVEVEIKPIVNKFITDLQQTIKGLNSKEVIASLQSALGDQSKSIKVNVIPSDANAFIKTLQGAIDTLNKPIKIKVEPIVKSFIKDITTVLTEQKKNGVPINLTPVINKAFKDELQQKIDAQKIHLGLIPDKNNIQTFIDRLQSAITLANKPIKVQVEPILKGFIKRCEEILANQAVNVNFKPKNPVYGGQGQPLNNAQMQQLIDSISTKISTVKTNTINGSITGATVTTTNSNGSKTVQTIDQYGNIKKTNITADINAQYKEVIAGYKEVLNYTKKLRTQTGEEAENTKQLLEETRKTTDNLYSSIKDRLNLKQQTYLENTLLKNISGVEVGNQAKEYNTAFNSYEKIRSKVEQLATNGRAFGNGQQYQAFKFQYENIISSFKENDINNVKHLTEELNNLYASYDKIGNLTKVQKTLYDVNKFMSDNSAMSAEMRHQFEGVRDRLQEMLSTGKYSNEELKDTINYFLELKNVAQTTGNVGKKFFTTLKQHLVSTNAQLVATYLGVRNIIRYIRSAIKSVTELDSALTQLKIVSNASDNALQNISEAAYEMAQNLGLGTTEVINSITEWRRLGKTVQESKILAEQAAKLSTGGMMDISTATTALVSSMQAFEMKADEVNKVVDQYIYLGNNYSITSEALATSLTKSMAALKVAGNSLEEIEALEIAGNAMVQDADTVSNSLKVLSLRLRGTTGSALEEIGEDTEGLIEDFSKLNNKIKDLTKTASNPEGISIVDKQTGGYKSTYKILLEISKVWKEIGDMQKAEILETIAGKTRATAAAAILESPELLERAYQDASENATGAGERAITASMESIEKKGQQLSNNLQQIFRNVLDSKEIKQIADSLISITNTFVNGASAIQPVLSLFLEVINGLLQIFKLPGAGVGLLGGIIGGKNQTFNNTQSIQNAATKLTKVTSLGITESDVQLYERYWKLLEEHKDQEEAWSKTFANASISAKNFVNSHAEIVEAGPEMLKLLEEEADKTKKVMIARQALNIVYSVAITAITSLIIRGISKLIHAEEEETKALAKSIDEFQESTDKYNEQNDTLDDLIVKYKEYTKQLNIINSKEEDSTDIKNSLSEIQQTIIKQYGKMAEGIDTVNGKYDEEIQKLETLQDTLADTYIAENAGKYQDAIKYNSTKYGGLLTWGEEFALDYFTGITGIGQADALRKMFERVGKDLDSHFTIQEFYDAMNEAITEEVLEPSEDYMIQAYRDDIIDIWSNQVIADSDNKFMKALNSQDIIEQYSRMVTLRSNYANEYQDFLNRVEELEKLASQGDEDYLNKYPTLLNDLRNWTTTPNEIVNQAFELLLKRVDNTALGKNSYANSKQRQNKIENNNVVDNIINDVKSLDNYATLLEKKTKLYSDADKKEYYTNSSLMSAYQTAISPYKDFIKYFENGAEEVNFGKLATALDTDTFFKQLGMDSFQSYIDGFETDAEILKTLGEEEAQQYIEGFGESADALGAYLKDVLKKVYSNMNLESLDASSFGLLTDNLYALNSELFSVSENVMKIEDSYWELRDVQKKIKDGVSFNQKEALSLMSKYEELESGVAEKYTEIDEESGKVIVKYKFHQSAIDSLVNSYATMSNEAISSMNNLGIYAEETINWLKQMELEILQMTLDMMNFGVSADTLMSMYEKRDSTLHDFLKYSGLTEEQQATVNKIFSDTSARISRIYMGSNLHLKENEDTNDSSGKGDKDNKSQYDWLDSYLDKRNRKLQKLQTAYDNLGKQIQNTNNIEESYYKAANENLTEQNQALDEKIAAYTRANEEYEKVRMHDKDSLLYKNLVDAFDGSKSKANAIIQKIINRESVELTEYTSNQASAISAIADTFNKALDAEDTILEAQNQKHENLLKQHSNDIELITKQYDHVLNEFANRQAELEHYQTMRTNAGMMENQKYYIALLDNESRELEANIQMRDKYINEIQEMNPTTEDELELWWDTKNAIDETTKSIWESQEAIESYQMSMKQLSWDLNDRIRDITGNLRNETEFLIDTLGTFEKDMYSYERQYLGNDAEKTKIYNGQMSAEGLSTLALRRVRAKSFREDIDAINDEIEEARADYMSNTANTTYLDRLNDLISERQNLIESYNDEREAIVQLVQEGYDKQLESLDAITNKTMEALQQQKDLYDFQKNVAKQTKNIANIRKMMNAYSGDDEESRMKLQQLQVQLEEAEEGLSDTQYQRQLEDQQRIFDHLYQSLSDYFADIMESPSQVLKSTESLVNDNMPQIRETLDKTMDFYDLEVSQSLKDILNENGLKGVKNNIATADGDIQGITQSVVNQTGELKEYYAKYHLEPTSETKLKDRMKILYGDAEGSFTDYFNQFNTKLGDINNAITDANQRAELFKELAHYISGAFITGLSSFMDTPITRSDNAILTPISMTQSSLSNSVDTVNKWLGISGISGKDIFSSGITPTNVEKKSDVTVNNSMSPTIVVNGVSNVSDFIKEFQKNKAAEAMVQSMTIGLLNGNSAMAKYKYKV